MGAADDGKRLWCWTLYKRAPAGTEEMLLKKMKIYMDKGGGSGRGKGNFIGARPGGRRISPDARFRGDVSRAARLSARISSPT